MATLSLGFFANIKKIVEKKAISSINESLQIIKSEVDANTPEDTGNLVASNKIEEARQEWNRIVWRVVNETEYAKFVEYWVWGKTYKYNKPKWRIFHIWIGARMFTKAFDGTRDTIIKKIKKDLW